jgi:hypothetical protein
VPGADPGGGPREGFFVYRAVFFGDDGLVAEPLRGHVEREGRVIARVVQPFARVAERVVVDVDLGLDDPGQPLLLRREAARDRVEVIDVVDPAKDHHVRAHLAARAGGHLGGERPAEIVWSPPAIALVEPDAREIDEVRVPPEAVRARRAGAGVGHVVEGSHARVGAEERLAFERLAGVDDKVGEPIEEHAPPLVEEPAGHKEDQAEADGLEREDEARLVLSLGLLGAEDVPEVFKAGALGEEVFERREGRAALAAVAAVISKVEPEIVALQRAQEDPESPRVRPPFVLPEREVHVEHHALQPAHLVASCSLGVL